MDPNNSSVVKMKRTVKNRFPAGTPVILKANKREGRSEERGLIASDRARDGTYTVRLDRAFRNADDAGFRRDVRARQMIVITPAMVDTEEALTAVLAKVLGHVADDVDLLSAPIDAALDSWTLLDPCGVPKVDFSSIHDGRLLKDPRVQLALKRLVSRLVDTFQQAAGS